MCAVSAVSDYYQRVWPDRFPNSPAPWQADSEVAKSLLEVLKRLDAIDKRLGDIECKDEAKAKFIAALERAAQDLKGAQTAPAASLLGYPIP